MTRPQVSGYRLQRRIAEGRSAHLWLALDEETNAEVVLKVSGTPLTTDFGVLDVFLFNLMSVTTHPHLLTVHSGGITEEGHPFLVCAACDAKPLADELLAEGLPLGVSLEMIIQLASAVRHLHHHGIIHGAISPEKILRTDSGTAVLGGFTFPGAERTGRLAPEVVRGADPDERSDVFGLGASMWELLGSADIPVKLQTLLAAAVADDPNHRIATVGELIAGLQDVQRSAGFEVTHAPQPAQDPVEFAAPRGATAHLDAVTNLRVIDPDTVTRVRLRDTWEEASADAETRVRAFTEPGRVTTRATLPLPADPVAEGKGVHAFDPGLENFAAQLYKPRATPAPVPDSPTRVEPPVLDVSDMTRSVPLRPRRHLVVMSSIGALVMLGSALGIVLLLG